MATKAFKEQKIESIKELLSKAQVAIVTEYKGLSVEEITKLRRNLQKEDGDYTVTKNTLAKIAVKGTEFEVLTDVFKGPIALAFGFKDQVSPAKAVAKFIKDTNNRTLDTHFRKTGTEITFCSSDGLIEAKVVWQTLYNRQGLEGCFSS